MPRPLIERNILHDFAITANQTMRRNAQMSNLGKERMRMRIQGTSEQRIDPRTAKFPGGRLMLCTTSKEGFSLHPDGIMVRRGNPTRARHPSFNCMRDLFRELMLPGHTPAQRMKCVWY